MTPKNKSRKFHGPLGRRPGLLIALLLAAAVLVCARHMRDTAPWHAMRATFSGTADRPVRLQPSGHASAERPAPQPPPDTAPIRVYFAPCAPEDPAGVDDVLLDLLARAQSRIDCAFYEFELASVADALIAKHRARVQVRVVSDSDYADEDGVRACIAAGVPVVFDEREALMHNKFCIVDGRYVWTGSTNITENGMFRNNNNALLLDAPQLAENFAVELLEMFDLRAFGARSPRNTPHPTLVLGDTSVACYFAPEDEPEESVVALVESARSRIDFMAFSYTSRPIADAMHERLRAGVAVRGIFETRSAGSSYSRDDFLAERGATIYLDDNPHTMHHKVIVVDGTVVATGSYNFSKSAAENNDENLLVLRDPRIAALYTAEFERLIPN